jgi:hypothetical protein
MKSAASGFRRRCGNYNAAQDLSADLKEKDGCQLAIYLSAYLTIAHSARIPGDLNFGLINSL